MKCRFVIDPKNKKKVFIPMCWSTVHSLDIDDCSCEDPLTEHFFEKERFNKEVDKKNETIKSLQSEIKHLLKMLKKEKL